MERTGIHSVTGEAVKVVAENGRICSVLPAEAKPGMPWISFGWIDLQVNGFAGFDLNGDDTTENDVVEITRALHAKGVASYFPTVVTGSNERMAQSLSAIAFACESMEEVRRAVPGIHLEGPYFCPDDGPRGAHDPRYVRNPDWNEFQIWQEAAGGRIRMVTLAPEREGAIPFIEKLVRSGVIVSIGHTNATAEHINRAAAAGASMSTHLGNGSHPVLPRHPNYIWDQLADDRLWGMFIPDGIHLPPSALKSMCRAKREKSILVSDCVRFGGMPPGVYKSHIGSEVKLCPDGRLHTVENPAILAGSAISLDRGLAKAVSSGAMGLKESVEAVTSRPSDALGLAGYGWLEPGAAANMTLFYHNEAEEKIIVCETIVQGTTVFEA